MGENEQGGMLRTVVVVGLIAIIAIVITVGVVGLKDNLRRETVVTAGMGSNYLTSHNLTAHQLVDNGVQTEFTDLGNDTYDLKLDKSTFQQGFFYGFGGNQATSGYDDFLSGDNWQFSAEMKVVSGDPSKIVINQMMMQGSNFKWQQSKALTSDWKKYTTLGTRVKIWGAPAIFFINNSGAPVEIQVRNVSLIRTN